MKALRKGDKGVEVKKWQYFLVGQGFTKVVADGNFGPITESATKEFQKKHKLTADGVVGTFTLAKAGTLGFELVKNPPTNSSSGIDFPPQPSFKSYTQSDLKRIFGNFKYDIQPNGSSIKITDNWEKDNLVYITVSALKTLPPYKTDKLRVHKKVASQFLQLFQDWEKAGLLHLLKTYEGSYNPRLIRGSDTALSTHSFGIAIDFNAKWNGLGVIPPKVGAEGSVRELVEIANKNGFYWGGHFTRKDGMHFEVAQVK
jgi:peptidoglycan hydrolase-like protein with peptidoglycan-binding domain